MLVGCPRRLSQQGHLTATCPSIHMKRLPILTSYDVGMTRSESVGGARRHALVGPCIEPWQILCFLPPSESSGPGGRAVSGSWSNESVCAVWRLWLTGLPTFCRAFLGLVVTASCASSMSVSGGLGAWVLSTHRPHSKQNSGTMPVIASLVTPHVSRISRKLHPS